jgi:catechol 2,3-dioxygenase-like lactoylglutathione lyase family enzyme
MIGRRLGVKQGSGSGGAMSVQLNHTIVPSRDKRAGADFITGILGLEKASPFGPFLVVDVANGVSLDYIDAGDGEIQTHHYAFLVGDDEFDPIFERIEAAGTYYADPHKQHPGEINHHYGGRGVYFDDPDGHVMEVITRPYGYEPPD